MPENPEQWLKDWSKQITTQVTFILDNADDVVDSADRSDFFRDVKCRTNVIEAKRDICRYVKKKSFHDPDLQQRVVRLKQLSVEEAKNIVISRVSDQHVRQKLSRTEKIVKLCGGIPLAL